MSRWVFIVTVALLWASYAIAKDMEKDSLEFKSSASNSVVAADAASYSRGSTSSHSGRSSSRSTSRSGSSSRSRSSSRSSSKSRSKSSLKSRARSARQRARRAARAMRQRLRKLRARARNQRWIQRNGRAVSVFSQRLKLKLNILAIRTAQFAQATGKKFSSLGVHAKRAIDDFLSKSRAAIAKVFRGIDSWAKRKSSKLNARLQKALGKLAKKIQKIKNKAKRAAKKLKAKIAKKSDSGKSRRKARRQARRKARKNTRKSKRTFKLFRKKISKKARKLRKKIRKILKKFGKKMKRARARLVQYLATLRYSIKASGAQANAIIVKLKPNDWEAHADNEQLMKLSKTTVRNIALNLESRSRTQRSIRSYVRSRAAQRATQSKALMTWARKITAQLLDLRSQLQNTRKFVLDSIQRV